MTSSIESVLAALNDAGVRYLIVGGVAVVLHGHLRTTADLDLVVDLRPENARAAIDVLTQLGFKPRAPVPATQFADEAARRDWITSKGMTVFSLWHPTDPALEIDLFVEEPFAFAQVYAQAIKVQLDRIEATLIPLATLIEMKQRTGRPQDLADVAALERIAEAIGDAADE